MSHMLAWKILSSYCHLNASGQSTEPQKLRVQIFVCHARTPQKGRRNDRKILSAYSATLLHYIHLASTQLRAESSKGLPQLILFDIHFNPSQTHFSATLQLLLSALATGCLPNLWEVPWTPPVHTSPGTFGRPNDSDGASYVEPNSNQTGRSRSCCTSHPGDMFEFTT